MKWLSRHIFVKQCKNSNNFGDILRVLRIKLVGLFLKGVTFMELTSADKLAPISSSWYISEVCNILKQTSPDSVRIVLSVLFFLYLKFAQQCCMLFSQMFASYPNIMLCFLMADSFQPKNVHYVINIWKEFYTLKNTVFRFELKNIINFVC